MIEKQLKSFISIKQWSKLLKKRLKVKKLLTLVSSGIIL